MARVQSITAILTSIFILTILFLVLHPFDFLDKDIETTYHQNEGLIWAMGLILGGGILIIQQLNRGILIDQKKCQKDNYQKSIIIENQNKEIIANQKEYINQARILNKSIEENTRKDIETLNVIHEVVNRVDNLEKAVGRLVRIDNRITSIEKLIKLHDAEIHKLKK